MPVSSNFRASSAFEALGDENGTPFYDCVSAACFPEHILRFQNHNWAAKTGLGSLSDDEWIGHFGQFQPLMGSLKQPLAIRYHGHQFRSYNPNIGDGRGFLFAQLFDAQCRLLDLATKGSGRTPYSRSGDGRLTLKGGIREILATEMLEALGVYTSKSFSLIETGERLERGDEPSPTRSAVLVRLGHSHVRFGVFQRLAAEQNRPAIIELVSYCVKNFYPHISMENNQTADFFNEVVRRSARLCAQWMAAGFVHGVLNTDNMNITGESFDYGPWRFLPAVDFGFTAAYFDQTGLYAYGRQPDAVAWNLAQLGGALSLVTDEAPLNEVLRTFPEIFEQEMIAAFFRRLGLRPAGLEAGAEDFDFIMSLLRWMDDQKVPFEQLFFDWFCGDENRAKESPNVAQYDDPSFSDIRIKLCGYEAVDIARLTHDYCKGEPCTMLIDEVEELWAAIADNDDWAPLSAKLAAINKMGEALAFDASVF